MSSASTEIVVSRIGLDAALCNGCGDCLSVCDEKALYLVDGSVEIDQGLCTACAECVPACPKGALHVIEAATLQTPEPHVAASEVVAASKQVALTAAQPRRAAWFGVLASAAQVALPRLLDFWLSRAEARTEQTTVAPGREPNSESLLQRQVASGGRRHRHRAGQRRHG